MLTVGSLTLQRERKVTPGDGKEEVATVVRKTDSRVRPWLQARPGFSTCWAEWVGSSTALSSMDEEVLMNLINTFQQPVSLLLRTLREEQWLLMEKEAVPLGTHMHPPSTVNTLREN